MSPSAVTSFLKGTLILWLAYLAGRDPRAWTEPLRLDPDRFLTPSDDQTHLQTLRGYRAVEAPVICIGFGLAEKVNRSDRRPRRKTARDHLGGDRDPPSTGGRMFKAQPIGRPSCRLGACGRSGKRGTHA